MPDFEEKTRVEEIDRCLYDFRDKVDAAMIIDTRLDEDTVLQLSKEKDDPEWMRDFRLKCLKIYQGMSMPAWGPPVDGLDMDNIITYIKPKGAMTALWTGMNSKMHLKNYAMASKNLQTVQRN